jgi:hypothetical protein
MMSFDIRERARELHGVPWDVQLPRSSKQVRDEGRILPRSQFLAAAHTSPSMGVLAP